MTFQEGCRIGPSFQYKLLHRDAYELHFYAHTGGFPSAPCVFKINSSIDSKRCALNYTVGWLYISLVGLDVCWARGTLKTLLSALH